MVQSAANSLKQASQRDRGELSPEQLLISVTRKTELCKSVCQVKEMFSSNNEGLANEEFLL